MIVISKDKSKLNIEVIHSFITNSYWGKGRTINEVEKTIEKSICYGVYKNDTQIGFARVVTDYTVFVYVMDVFILPTYRGKGYSKKIMRSITTDEDLKNCKTWMLKTSDAHGLYNKYGFTELKNPEKVMEKIVK